MKRVLLFPILMIGILAANCQQTQKDGKKPLEKGTESTKVTEIEPAQLKQVLEKQEKIQLFDVRTPKEFSEGSIVSAVNINFFDSDFVAQMSEVAKKDQPIYLFCRSGRRSSGAVEKLQNLGFTEIYNLKGGFLAWSEEN